MTVFAAPYLLTLALIAAQVPLPRMTHAEGLVTSGPGGVSTAGGLAEIVLADGAIIHLDAGTSVRYTAGTDLTIDDGRVIVRAGGGPLSIDTPLATLRLLPGAICTLIVDRVAGRLLVAVPFGELMLRTRYAHVTRVAAGQSAMMTSATAVPWAVAYTRAQLDRFAVWSDARIASTGQATGASGEWAASGLSGASFGSTVPCTSWPSWGAPCWTLPPAPPHPHPRLSPHGLPFPPSYAPNYAPNFSVAPPEPTAPAPRRPGRARPAEPTAAPPAAPAPAPPQPPVRGRSGAVRPPERPSSR